MPTVHSFEIKVGLLVLAGVVATVAMIMSADQIRVEDTYTMSAYVQDAGGLRLDSPVTLSGITVGKVQAMEFVPTGVEAPGRVKLTITVARGVKLPEGVAARLASSGVFGDASLALSASRATSGKLLPDDGSASVVVAPGVLDQAVDKAGGVLSSVDDLLSPTTRADVKRLVANTADLTGHAAAVAARLSAEQERLATIVANLEAISGELVTTTKLLNVKLDPLLTRADAVLTRVDSLMVAGTTAITSADTMITRADAILLANQERIAAMLQAVATAASRVERITALLEGGDGILGQLLVNRDLATDLQHVSVDLRAAAAQVADKPSRLVFDDSDSARQAEQAKRNRDKMRRTLAEGLGEPLP